ncbi:hypothetical protein FLAVO9AF_110093 [Flavobacterium sp. 9AF]|nr:hypothetical protein FLAVO9AF_110093 [Flavobacterium sp. 9AF]
MLGVFYFISFANVSLFYVSLKTFFLLTNKACNTLGLCVAKVVSSK